MDSNAKVVERSRYGTDLVLRSFARGEGGSLPSVSGRANLEQALMGILYDPRGSLLHRPDYGSDIFEFLGEANSPFGRARLANSLYRSLSRDPRFASVQVQARPGDNTARVIVEISITPYGETSAQAISFVVPLD